MTVLLTRPSASEWQLTVQIGDDADADSPAWAVTSDADAERLAGLLAQFAGLLLVRPAAGARDEQTEPPAICFL